MSDGRGAPVLIVDADADFRSHVVRALTRAGLTTMEATGGAEGLELAIERPAAVVLEAEPRRASTGSRSVAPSASSTGTTCRS